ncbi:MAG: hypothetical protein J7L38_08400 [Thermoproteales archaeon]|mgnify:CR=1 FL=1|nr:hypothetical protein [Thermoproteales archaeon]
MKRTNKFIIEDNPALWELADNCARLYNELNFERRQAYIHYKNLNGILSIFIGNMLP